MDIPCECMARQNSRGEYRCAWCAQDWYSCDCDTHWYSCDRNTRVHEDYTPVDTLAQDLQIGDTIRYCGATYEVKSINRPDEYNFVLIYTIKSAHGTIISDNYVLVREFTETVQIIN